MTTTSVILIALITVAILFVQVFFLEQHKANRLSQLASLAFAFMIAGIFLARQPLIGYSLLAVGLTLAVADIIQKSKDQSGKNEWPKKPGIRSKNLQWFI